MKNLLFIFALLCMVAQGAWADNVNLSEHSMYFAKDGDVLTGGYAGGGVYIQDGATVTLHNVNILPDPKAGDSNGFIRCQGDATIILEGYNNIKSSECSPLYVMSEGKKLTIKGDGQYLHVVGDVAWAGIGGNGGNLVIESGNITAESTTRKGDWLFIETEEGGGSGIGRSTYDTNLKNVTINGGNINVCGGALAEGISCEEQGSITITGGNIQAWAGQQRSGIGGRNCSVIITGGTITAHGGKYGAGIGGSNDGSGGIIKITGGTVKAYGGTDAAGIGGGEDGDSGFITIDGGDVYAQGNGWGVGIGAGEDGNVPPYQIRINGGTVEALGGEDIKRAIGGEDDEDYSSIYIDDIMKVTDASTSGSTLFFAYRGLFLSPYNHLKFEPCDHAGQTLSYVYVDKDNHKFACQWCGWHEEKHTDNPQTVNFDCTKCTYNETPYYAHYYEMVYNEQKQKYEYQEVASEIFKDNLILPAHKGTVPDDRIFVAWVAGEPDANDDGILKEASYFQYSSGQYISTDATELNFKARYVNKTLDLATVQSDQKIYDGMTLTGTLNTASYPVKITLANNATVTLSGMNISGVNNSNYSWAGINCEGNATIILADGTTNTVKGFYEKYPGINVPSSYTLTIKGAGSLNASSNGKGAGIGSGYGPSVSTAGNINIQGGNITATGGENAAGIGSNYNNSCGNITISGGTINATGGNGAAGIGSGAYHSSCGTINITSNVTCVTATKGGNAPNSIGAGYTLSTCGNVSIGDVTGTIASSSYTYFPLANAGSNHSMISDNNNRDCGVTLKDRTLYVDHKWNTLCLPFDVTLEGSPLAGAEARTLSSANLSDDGILSLNFSEPVTTLTAGTPYIIKWDNINEEELSLKNADFVIRTEADWNTFADNVNNGNNYSGKTVALAADITVTKMVGESEAKSFKGTFNGNGHTLTFTHTGYREYNAPFRYIYGATISNLHTKGTITTNCKFSSGLVAYAESYNVINNCWSSVEINSTVNGDGTHGGIVAYTEEGRSNTTLNNCLFDGKIIGANTHSCGGLVGWNFGEATLNNCVFRPQGITLSSDNNATFCRGSNVSVYNCYYSENLPDASGQGTEIGEMTNEGLVAALGDGWQIKDGKVVPGIMVLDFSHVENPTFTNVKITAPTPIDITPDGSGSDGSVTFKGTYDPVTIGSDGDDTMLYLSSGNKLYWPNGAMNINAFRAYFQLNVSSNVRGFSMNFLDSEEVTGIKSVNGSRYDSDAWFTLDGRNVNGKPAMNGIYIKNGKKVVIK